MLLFSSDIQLNPGLAPFINVSATSPLDVCEPFSSLSYAKLRVATLNARSISNKSAVICDQIIKNRLDVLCISENWIYDGEMTNSLLSSLFSPTIVFLRAMEDLNCHMVEVLLSLIIILFTILQFQFCRFPYLNISVM